MRVLMLDIFMPTLHPCSRTHSPLPHGADTRLSSPTRLHLNRLPKKSRESCHHQGDGRFGTDSQTGILATEVSSAMCVQRLDDSQVCADRITFRISLRSSSLQEPRDPLLKVVCCSHSHISPDLHTCAEHEHGRERHSASPAGTDGPKPADLLMILPQVHLR